MPMRNGKPMVGKNHPNWKGNRCLKPIRQRLHCSYQWARWRKAVFKRDNWTCKKCNQRGGRLNVHHYKVSFSKILSCLEKRVGIKNLYETAINYKPLWDIKNGQTLCIKCHKETNNYLKFSGSQNNYT